MKKINYKGYTVSQAKNNHVVITKNNEMIFHAQCTKKLTEEELKGQVEWYIKLFSQVECVEDDN